VCAGIGAIAALWSGVNGWQAFGENSKAADVTQQIAAQDVQYQQITKQFPPAPTTGENLKRAVEAAKQVRESARDPVPMMAAVSEALQTSPNVVLRDFGWRYGLTDIEKAAEGAAGGSAGAASASSQPAPGAPPAARRQSAFLSGEIRPFRGDYRGAIDTINALAERLRKNPAVAEVRATKMPLNVSPTAALSGNTLDSTRTEAAKADFELVVVFKPRV
jgi:hypothetical protein